MRCTTDSVLPGSVIMEFVIVLPLYLLLLGAAVLLGDLGLRSIWVTHADGLAVASGGDGSAAAKLYLGKQFPVADFYEYEVGPKLPQDIPCFESATRRAKSGDEAFRGSWGAQVAGLGSDQYALPPWARGWLVYAAATYRHEDDGGFLPGILSGLLNTNFVGRLRVVSRDLKGSGGQRKYGLYTLMRTVKARNRQKPYRAWGAKELSGAKSDAMDAPLVATVGTEWYKHVYKEPFLDSDPAKLDEKADGNEDGYPSKPSRSDYPRGSSLLIMSQ